MYHAVVLACDPGFSLRPLTDDETPLAFLRLGDRRTLVQRAIDRLVEAIPLENVWVIAGPEGRIRAEAELGGVRIASDPNRGGGAIDSLVTVLSTITSSTSPSATVLLQPATHVVTDEAGYRKRLLSGLAEASSREAGISFSVDGARGRQQPTGIQAWPAYLLGMRLVPFARCGSTPLRDALAVLEADLATVPMGDVGWLDVSDWASVQRLLAYVEKPWGHERLWALNRYYAGKVLFIKAGESLSLQYHETKDETIRIASGRMRFRSGASADTLVTVLLEPGMSYAIPPRLVHQMEAIEDCTVIEVSTPHLADVVRIEDRYGRA